MRKFVTTSLPLPALLFVAERGSGLLRQIRDLPHGEIGSYQKTLKMKLSNVELCTIAETVDAVVIALLSFFGE